MPHVLTARDGRNHTVMDERDVLRLVSEYMGTEFRDWLEDWAADLNTEYQEKLDEIRELVKETETELDRLKNHQRQVFTEVYEDAERLMALSEADHPEPSEINRLAENIWFTVQDEL